MPSHRSRSSPAKGPSNHSEQSSPPPRASTSDDEAANPLRAQRLSTLASLHALLSNHKASFQLPSSLTFLPSATAAAPKLDFRANNAPLLAYEDEMVRMLTKLDEVQSEGDMVVRDARKKIVREVEEELERLDGVRRSEWERQQSGGESEQEKAVREKKEKVDRMLQSKGTAPAHAPTSHQVAEEAIEHNQHGKREDISRGRGSPQSGGEEFSRQRSPQSSPKSLPNGDRYSKVRKQEAAPQPSSTSSKPLPSTPIPSAFPSRSRGGNFFDSLPSRFS